MNKGGERMTEKLLFCDCGNWHNTTAKCPDCGTVATHIKLEIIRGENNIKQNCSSFDAGYFCGKEEILKKVKEIINKNVTIHGNFEVDRGLVISAIICERKRIVKELGIE